MNSLVIELALVYCYCKKINIFPSEDVERLSYIVGDNLSDNLSPEYFSI